MPCRYNGWLPFVITSRCGLSPESSGVIFSFLFPPAHTVSGSLWVLNGLLVSVGANKRRISQILTMNKIGMIKDEFLANFN